MRPTPSQRPKDKTPNKARVILLSLGISVQKLCSCCVRVPMRPEHEQQVQPITRTGGDTGVESTTPDFEFTQLGPNDVSYKERTQPKMVHHYILGEVLGEGILSLSPR
jgi:hypothetical protein